ncbi:MAG TPA: alpha/beta hydrolase [Acidisarcina sp.]
MRDKSDATKRPKHSQFASRSRPSETTSLSAVRSYGSNQQFPLVSARWLATWFIASLFFAAACTYLGLCILFYLGQWQIIFHPSSSVTATPSSLGIPFDDVHFDYTETGLPQLNGWWLAASPRIEPRPHAIQTILFLHGADGSLSDTLPSLEPLHALGVNIFAIDYRGFGLSMNTHPSEQRVYQDADAALVYLVEVRHVAPASVIVYGQGLGATIAAELARRHPQIGGLILDDPAPPALTLIYRDPRTKLLPVKLLFRDRFELEPKLQNLPVPKLFIEGSAMGYFAAASHPKTLLVAAPGAAHAALPQVANFVRALAPSSIQWPQY